MDVAEFDRFADEYHAMHVKNVAITGEQPEYFAQYKVAVLRRVVDEAGLRPGRIVDFGAGIGNSVPYIRALFPDAALTCTDVSQRSLDLSKARNPGAAEQLLVAEQIPAEAATYDLAFSACVFHHIPHEEHGRWLGELLRVVRPGGMLSIFEHNPLNPLTVRAVNTCPFDENARLIRAGAFARAFAQAGWEAPRVRYHLFFPRALAGLRGLEGSLERVPLGAQYSVTAVRPA